MKQYIVFYKDATGNEQSLPIEAKDRFAAKFIAFDQHNVALTQITRVL